MCCSPWGCKESDTTEQLNNNNREKKNAGEEGRNCQWPRVKAKLKEKIVLEMSGYQITVAGEGREIEGLNFVYYICCLEKIMC